MEFHLQPGMTNEMEFLVTKMMPQTILGQGSPYLPPQS